MLPTDRVLGDVEDKVRKVGRMYPDGTQSFFAELTNALNVQLIDIDSALHQEKMTNSSGAQASGGEFESVVVRQAA